ncbi:MAG: N-acetylglucosamine kinase [Pirellulaceae bacterium]
MDSDSLILGIDGGGSHTRAWLGTLGLESDGGMRIHRLGVGRSGGSNPRVEGMELACKNLMVAIEAAFQSASLQRRPLDALCMGLAGAGRPEEQRAVGAWVGRQQLAKRVEVCGDVELILDAAGVEVGSDSDSFRLRPADALPRIAVLAGTGSNSFAATRLGERLNVGGWGPWIGDEGSGYSIACEGLRLATQAVDQIGPPTGMVAAFNRHWGVTEPRDWISKLYAMPRQQVALLSALVFDQAARGDELASRVIDQGAMALARLARSLASQLGCQQYHLLMAGGLLVGYDRYRQLLLKQLDQPGAIPLVIEEPVVGAMRRAGQMLAKEEG